MIHISTLLYVCLFCLLALGLGACKSTQQSTLQNKNQTADAAYGSVKKSEATSPVSEEEVKEASMSLSDYLRRIPGVYVQGRGENATVMVRGYGSLEANHEPLFIVNGSIMGNSYSQVARMIDSNDIKSVSVLKDVSSTSVYGMQGQNGVILIKLKKKD